MVFTTVSVLIYHKNYNIPSEEISAQSEATKKMEYFNQLSALYSTAVT